MAKRMNVPPGVKRNLNFEQDLLLPSDIMSFPSFQHIIYKNFFWFSAFLFVATYSIFSTFYIIYLFGGLYRGAATNLSMIDEEIRSIQTNLELCKKGKFSIPLPLIPCHDGWTFYNRTNSCYKAFDMELSYSDARSICQHSLNDPSLVDLASILSLDENYFIYRLFLDPKGAAWIGLQRPAGRERFNEWNDGKAVKYQNWADGEPENDVDSHSGAILQLDWGLDWQHWKVDSVEQRHQFVCQQTLKKISNEEKIKEKTERDLDNCIDCMCTEESNCRNETACNNMNGVLACGYFQISLDYYKDCGLPEKDKDLTEEESWKRCASEWLCSKECIKKYYERYESNCKDREMSSCEKMARLHKGGPNGCSQNYTIEYWNLVKAGCQ